MRRPIVPLLAVLAGLIACHESLSAGGFASAAPPLTGRTAMRAFPATGFDKVVLAGADDVRVTPGAGFAVAATGDPAVLDTLEIIVRDGTLRIARRRGMASWWRDAGDRARARVAVSLPVLHGATLAGSGDMHVAALAGDRFEGVVAGSGDLALPALRLREAALTVAGSGRLSAGGQTRGGTFSVAGSGDIDARALRAETLSLSMTGSGSLAASARGSASVSMVGSGQVRVTGGARCAVTRIGSGAVSCG